MPSEFQFARSLLRQAFGENTDFRPGQWKAIRAVLRPGTRRLEVRRTGWGKSIVYFVAAAIQRRRNRGITLVVSPLLALMRNQIEMATRMGIRAASIESTNELEWPGIEKSALEGSLDVLFISPERLGHLSFQGFLDDLCPEIAFLVVDEAHCISEWGHDFRPNYRRLGRLVKSLPSLTPVLATTATATKRITDDIVAELGGQFVVSRGSSQRENLRLSSFEMDDPAERLAFLARYIPKFNGVGIVYCLTVFDAELVVQFLGSRGIPCVTYHSALQPEERKTRERQFGDNRWKAIVATSALGMGYDKADVGFVAHYQLPLSAAAYYQQIGRAGRMLEVADGCLLFGESDLTTARQLFNVGTFSFDDAIRAAKSVLNGAESLADVARQAGLSREAASKALEFLRIEGMITKDESGYRPVETASMPTEAQFQLRMEARDEDCLRMISIARTRDCLMSALASELGDPENKPCGRCDRCRKRETPILPTEDVEAARSFLTARTWIIAPKTSLRRSGRKGIILRHSNLPGLALSLYNDSGLGEVVRGRKYSKSNYGEELLKAAVEAAAGLPKIDWVTCIPSLSNPSITDFSKELAARIGVEFHAVVMRTERLVAQKKLDGDLAQWSNAETGYVVNQAWPGAVLLVDDVVDSGWTLAVVGAKLIEAGADHVVPLALASAQPRRAASSV